MAEQATNSHPEHQSGYHLRNDIQLRTGLWLHNPHPIDFHLAPMIYDLVQCKIIHDVPVCPRNHLCTRYTFLLSAACRVQFVGEELCDTLEVGVRNKS
jgi:hypothetical protein